MPKYTVRIWETVFHTAQVEADNDDEAYEKGWDVIANGAGEYDTESDGFTGYFVIDRELEKWGATNA
jgi:hypothetical protein